MGTGREDSAESEKVMGVGYRDRKTKRVGIGPSMGRALDWKRHKQRQGSS